MTEYRLRKDLGLAKAGTKVAINNQFKNDIQSAPLVVFLNTVYVQSIEILNKLLAEGWVENVTPKNFFIELKRDQFDNWQVNDVSEKESDLKCGGFYKIIKVREIID